MNRKRIYADMRRFDPCSLQLELVPPSQLGSKTFDPKDFKSFSE